MVTLKKVWPGRFLSQDKPGQHLVQIPPSLDKKHWRVRSISLSSFNLTNANSLSCSNRQKLFLLRSNPKSCCLPILCEQPTRMMMWRPSQALNSSRAWGRCPAPRGGQRAIPLPLLPSLCIALLMVSPDEQQQGARTPRQFDGCLQHRSSRWGDR